MSMTMLTALQLAGTSGAYMVSTIFIPFLLLRKRLRTLPAPARSAAYFTVGNFYIIVLVLFLQLIHLSCRASLIIGALAPFPIAFLRRDKAADTEHMTGAADVLRRIVERDLKGKTMLVRLAGKLRGEQYLRRFCREILPAGVMLALLFGIYGLNLFGNFGYGHPDLIGYHARINELSRNGISLDSVRSFGFNGMICFLHTVYGIKTMTLLRLFGIVRTAALCLMLAAFMKTIVRNAFIPYLTAAGFLALGLYVPSLSEQLTYALPQLYGAVFLPAAALFLISFFKECHSRRESRGSGSAARLYLIFFCISVLTACSALFGGNPGGESVRSDAVICIENILHDNKGKDDTWTVVSTYDIGLMTGEYGSHYEAAAFLNDINDPGADGVQIETPTVYVCIDKAPASDERRAVMAELSRWVQCFRGLYPNEADVYLETDSFVCYRINQNGSFYNLAIDYGYDGEGSL